jgi:hypothetical protein
VQTLRYIRRYPMTAVDLPRFSAADLWLARTDAIRHVAELVVHQRITDDDGHARVTRLTGNLDDETRNDAWEQLTEAEKRLNHIRSDDWDPTEGWRDDLELQADADARNAIEKLAGPRP